MLPGLTNQANAAAEGAHGIPGASGSFMLPLRTLSHGSGMGFAAVSCGTTPN